MKWKQVEINKQSIEFETDHAVLIKCPNNSEYKRYKFWHPLKLVSFDNSSVKLSYTDEFTFNIFKNGSGKHNKYKQVDSRELTSEDIEGLFEIFKKGEELNSYLEVIKPKKLIVKSEVDECLLNN